MTTNWIERVAAKLECEELTKETYTIDKAKRILSECCLPTALIGILTKNEAAIIGMLP